MTNGPALAWHPEVEYLSLKTCDLWYLMTLGLGCRLTVCGCFCYISLKNMQWNCLKSDPWSTDFNASLNRFSLAWSPVCVRVPLSVCQHQLLLSCLAEVWVLNTNVWLLNTTSTAVKRVPGKKIKSEINQERQMQNLTVMHAYLISLQNNWLHYLLTQSVFTRATSNVPDVKILMYDCVWLNRCWRSAVQADIYLEIRYKVDINDERESRCRTAPLKHSENHRFELFFTRWKQGQRSVVLWFKQ